MSGASLRRAKDAPLWQGYAAAALVLLFVYFCLRNGSAAQTGVYELFSVAAPLAVAAPVGDLLLLVGLMQLVFRRRAGNFALRAVMVAVASTLVADAIYSYLNLKGAYTSGMLVDAGWLIANAAWAVAALHPSMRSIRSIPEQMREGLSVLRIALLVGAL